MAVTRILGFRRGNVAIGTARSPRTVNNLNSGIVNLINATPGTSPLVPHGSPFHVGDFAARKLLSPANTRSNALFRTICRVLGIIGIPICIIVIRTNSTTTSAIGGIVNNIRRIAKHGLNLTTLNNIPRSLAVVNTPNFAKAGTITDRFTSFNGHVGTHMILSNGSTTITSRIACDRRLNNTSLNFSHYLLIRGVPTICSGITGGGIFLTPSDLTVTTLTGIGR